MADYSISRFCAPDLMAVDYKISVGDSVELDGRKKIHKYREPSSQVVLLKKLDEKIKAIDTEDFFRQKYSSGEREILLKWVSNGTINNFMRQLIINNINPDINRYEEQILNIGYLIEDRFVKILNTIVLCLESCGDGGGFVISDANDFSEEMKEEIKLRFPITHGEFFRLLHADFVHAFKKGIFECSRWRLFLVYSPAGFSICIAPLRSNFESDIDGPVGGVRAKVKHLSLN